jgi:hypothetical protein
MAKQVVVYRYESPWAHLIWQLAKWTIIAVVLMNALPWLMVAGAVWLLYVGGRAVHRRWRG